jgi:prepilin-type N-terminal cleavage/methylation domain-containing protein
MKKILPKKKGFSLLEILIVMGIAAAVVIVVSNVGTNVGNLNGLISNNLQSKSDIAQTLQIIASEIRGAQPSASGAYPIVSAGTSTFAFYSNIKGTGAVYYVAYTLSSSTIFRTIIAPSGTPATYPTSSQVVSDMVDNISLVASTSLFTYYSASYTGAAGQAVAPPVAVASVRLVRIVFDSATAKNSSQPSPPQYFSTLIAIRNLDSN